VSDPARGSQTRPEAVQRGRSRPSASVWLRRRLSTDFGADPCGIGAGFVQGVGRIRAAECGQIGVQDPSEEQYPLKGASSHSTCLECGVRHAAQARRRRVRGRRPSRRVIVERNARASSLGAARRPQSGFGLDPRACRSAAGNYVMASMMLDTVDAPLAPHLEGAATVPVEVGADSMHRWLRPDRMQDRRAQVTGNVTASGRERCGRSVCPSAVARFVSASLRYSNAASLGLRHGRLQRRENFVAP
jgi:hypothetical protein